MGHCKESLLLLTTAVTPVLIEVTTLLGSGWMKRHSTKLFPAINKVTKSSKHKSSADQIITHFLPNNR